MRQFNVAGKVIDIPFAFGIKTSDIIDLVIWLFFSLVAVSVIGDMLPEYRQHVSWLLVVALFIGIWVIYKTPDGLRPRTYMINFLDYHIHGNEYYKVVQDSDRGEIKIKDKLLTEDNNKGE